MPQMISLRSFRLETKTGHVLQFVAREPMYVPPSAVPDAMAAGCVPASEADVPFVEDSTRTRVEFVGDIRKSMLFLAIGEIVQRNIAKEFDGSGTPKTAVVADLIGFEVARREVVELFQKFMETRGQDLELHPAAENIRHVLRAEDKAELMELAEEFGLDTAKAKGLQIRDLRKQLLIKLGGVAVTV